MTNPIPEKQTLSNTCMDLTAGNANSVSASCPSKIDVMDIHEHLPPSTVSGIKGKREGSPPGLSAKVESNPSNGPDRKIKKIRTETGIGPNSIEHKHTLSSCIDAPASNPQVFLEQLRSGVFTALTELSKLIALANDRWKAYRLLATMRTDPQQFDEWLRKALSNARWITDPTNQSTALLEIACTQAKKDPKKVGELFIMALQASSKMPLTSPLEKMKHTSCVNQIVCLQAQVDPRKAQCLLNHPGVGLISYYIVIKALAEIDQEEAIHLADYYAEQSFNLPNIQEINGRFGIDDSLQSQKENYYQFVTEGVAVVNPEEAIKLIFQLITNDRKRAQGIAAIIRSHPATNLETILECVNQLQDTEAKEIVLSELVKILAKIDLSQASIVAEQITLPQNKISGCICLINALAKIDIEKAFNLFEELKKQISSLETQTIYSLGQQNTALIHILAELVKSNPMKVLEISETITSNEEPYFFKDQARCLAACELAKTDLPLTLSIAQSLPNKNIFDKHEDHVSKIYRPRDRAYCAIAEAEAVTDLEQALKKVDLIEEQMTRDKAYAAIAQAAALNPSLQVQNIVNLIQDPETRNQTYTAIALAQTDPEKALEVIDLIQDVSMQIKTLAVVGKKHIPSDTNLASQFFKRALVAAESTKPDKDLCPYSTFQLVCHIFNATFA